MAVDDGSETVAALEAFGGGPGGSAPVRSHKTFEIISKNLTKTPKSSLSITSLHSLR
nr:hypothetical protein Itr_chr02CG15460 [Ipomoea trifida]